MAGKGEEGDKLFLDFLLLSRICVLDFFSCQIGPCVFFLLSDWSLDVLLLGLTHSGFPFFVWFFVGPKSIFSIFFCYKKIKKMEKGKKGGQKWVFTVAPLYLLFYIENMKNV